MKGGVATPKTPPLDPPLGGGAVRFRPDTKSRVCARVCVHPFVCCTLQARYEKPGGGGGGGGRVVAVRFRSDTKSGKGGGGAVRFRLDSIISTRPCQTKNYTTFEIGYNQPAYTTV